MRVFDFDIHTPSQKNKAIAFFLDEKESIAYCLLVM